MRIFMEKNSNGVHTEEISKRQLEAVGVLMGAKHELDTLLDLNTALRMNVREKDKSERGLGQSPGLDREIETG